MPFIKQFNKLKLKLKVWNKGTKLLILVDIIVYIELFLIEEPLK